MMYEDLIADFARRTATNLEAIRKLREMPGAAPVYEITQLVNSMLGLLVFPQQRYMDRIPEVPLAELQQGGWPVPEVVGDFKQVKDLRQLVRMLRNAVAHCNVEFRPGPQNEIEGLTVWNTTPDGRRVTWKAQLTVTDLEGITQRFIELLLDRKNYG